MDTEAEILSQQIDNAKNFLIVLPNVVKMMKKRGYSPVKSLEIRIKELASTSYKEFIEIQKKESFSYERFSGLYVKNDKARKTSRPYTYVYMSGLPLHAANFAKTDIERFLHVSSQCQEVVTNPNQVLFIIVSPRKFLVTNEKHMGKKLHEQALNYEIQKFEFKFFATDIDKQRFSSKIRIIHQEDSEKYWKSNFNYKIEKIDNLPKCSKADPICILYDLRHGDIIIAKYSYVEDGYQNPCKEIYIVSDKIREK